MSEKFDDSFDHARYAIQNTSGLWWTGNKWGNKHTREEYEKFEDIPLEIDGLCLWHNSITDPLDAGYDSISDDFEISARVYAIE